VSFALFSLFPALEAIYHQMLIVHLDRSRLTDSDEFSIPEGKVQSFWSSTIVRFQRSGIACSHGDGPMMDGANLSLGGREFGVWVWSRFRTKKTGEAGEFKSSISS
jgi:hypothetical protein